MYGLGIGVSPSTIEFLEVKDTAYSVKDISVKGYGTISEINVSSPVEFEIGLDGEFGTSLVLPSEGGNIQIRLVEKGVGVYSGGLSFSSGEFDRYVHIQGEVVSS